MPRPVRVLLWTVVFVGAAGIGAFVAAHSNPFPPSVERSPGTSLLPLTSGPTPPPAAIWKGTIRSSTAHRLYVGGRCETDWRGSLVVSIDQQGRADGVATVRRVGALRCDFLIAQAQIASYLLAVRGSRHERRFELHLTEISSTPSSGADDYGGFQQTLLVPGPRSTSLLGRRGTAAGVLSILRVDREGRGTYVSHTRVRLSCTRYCG